MVHVGRETRHDVRGRVVRQQRRAGLIEDVQDVVDGLHHVPIANAEPLVGRLDGELVPPARIALLVQVQALETRLERGVGLRPGDAGCRYAPAAPMREADTARKLTVERLRTLISFVVLGLPRKLVLHRASLVACRREVARLRTAGPDARHEARRCKPRGRLRPCRCRRHTDGNGRNRGERDHDLPVRTHSSPLLVISPSRGTAEPALA